MDITARYANETRKDYALRIIRDNIIHLNLEPGSLVNMNDLVAELGVSRSSVREALSELSKTHIVEVVPQSGSRISLVDLNLVDEARFLRNTLECAVTKELCESRTAEQLVSLKKNIRLQEIYLEYNMTDKLLELDNDFHKMLFDFANKTEIYELVHNFSIHYDRLRSMTMVAVKNLKIVEDHRTILAYIESRDVERAIALMDCHLSRYIVESDEIKERYPTYFKK